MTMKKRLPRGLALAWLKAHRGLTEDPPYSNTDNRADGIRRAQLRLGAWLVKLPWCGVWFANALLRAGVDFRGTAAYLLASVANIEDLARAHKGPFTRGWCTPQEDWWNHVLRGDGVVLFGRGVHVGTVRRTSRLLGLVWTDEGNTSPGDTGSQSNGGGAFRRVRRITDVHGFALVNYPGGPR